MEIQEALKIMRALADGVSPETGEILTAEVVHHYAPVVKAVHRTAGALEILEERERDRRSLPTRGGKTWSRSEDRQVCEELWRGVDFHQIAAAHNRTVGSILMRLLRLKQIGPNTPIEIVWQRAA